MRAVSGWMGDKVHKGAMQGGIGTTDGGRKKKSSRSLAKRFSLIKQTHPSARLNIARDRGLEVRKTLSEAEHDWRQELPASRTISTPPLPSPVVGGPFVLFFSGLLFLTSYIFFVICPAKWYRGLDRGGICDASFHRMEGEVHG